MLKFLKVPKSSISFIVKEEPFTKAKEDFSAAKFTKSTKIAEDEKRKSVSFQEIRSDKKVQTFEDKKTNTEKVSSITTFPVRQSGGSLGHLFCTNQP